VKIDNTIIEEIYKEYMKLDIKEANDFLKTKTDEYDLQEKGYLRGKLLTYAKKLSKDDYEAYICKRDQANKINWNYIKIIEEFKEDITNGVMPNFKLLEPKALTEQKIYSYLNVFPKDKEFVIKLLKECKKYLNGEIKEFDIIEELNKEVEEKIVTKRAHVNSSYNFSKNEVENARVIIIDLILSELSIEDYAHINIKYTIKNIRDLIVMAANKDNAILNAIKEKLEKREIVLIKESIEVDYEKLKVNKELDVIDYFMITRLNVFDMLSVLKNNYAGQYGSFENYVRTLKNKHYLFRSVPENFISKSQEINSGITIRRGFEFTTEEKGLILDFMEDKIVMSTINYSLIMDKLANGEVITDTITGKTLSLELQKVKEL